MNKAYSHAVKRASTKCLFFDIDQIVKNTQYQTGTTRQDREIANKKINHLLLNAKLKGGICA